MRRRLVAGAMMVLLVVLMIPSSAVAAGTWSAQTSGTTTGFLGVDFVDANNGWGVGYSGMIRNTSNGGSTWNAQTSGVGAYLYDVDFINGSTGWAAGANGTVVGTTNGGSSWSLLSTSGIGNDVYGLSFASGTTGWYARGGAGQGIYQTTNSGTTWTFQTAFTGEPRDVFFVDASNGWAVGSGGEIQHTNNGGSTWTGQTSGTTQLLRRVVFTDTSNGWAVGQNGTILHTANGGTTWTAQSSGTSTYIVGIDFSDANNGKAVGVTGGLVLGTTDGGATWNPEQSGTTQNLSDVSMASATAAWIVGANGTIFTYSAPPPSVEAVPTGSNVTVTDTTYGVVVTFSQVTAAGSLSVSPQTSAIQPPDSNRVDGAEFDITTTATYIGPVTVTIPYNPGNVTGDEAGIQVYRYNGSSWDDVSLSVDTGGNTATGQFTSLSPWGLWTSSGGAGYVSTDASSVWSLALLAVIGFGILAWRGVRLGSRAT